MSVGFGKKRETSKMLELSIFSPLKVRFAVVKTVWLLDRLLFQNVPSIN